MPDTHDAGVETGVLHERVPQGVRSGTAGIGGRNEIMSDTEAAAAREWLQERNLWTGGVPKVLAEFALSLKPGWEREAVRAAFEKVKAKAKQLEADDRENGVTFGDYTCEAMDAILREYEKGGEKE